MSQKSLSFTRVAYHNFLACVDLPFPLKRNEGERHLFNVEKVSCCMVVILSAVYVYWMGNNNTQQSKGLHIVIILQKQRQKTKRV